MFIADSKLFFEKQSLGTLCCSPLQGNKETKNEDILNYAI